MVENVVSPFAVMIAMLIMAIACACQASVGIGMALLAAPVLAVVEPRFIPGPMLLAGVILAGATAYRDRGSVDVRGLGISLVGLASGTVIGALVLTAVSGSMLPKVFGALVLVAVALSTWGFRVETSAVALALGGGAAGVMGTIVGIHGPPIALVFQNARPDVARAMLGAFFACAYVGTVLALTAVGLFGRPELWLAAMLLPGVAAGLLAAPLIAARIDRRRLRWAILLISASSGAILLLR
jgi:uncharacterized membrane protein YfcA